MKVKLLTSRAGPGVSQVAGEEIDVSADEAQRMIDAGQAELVRSNAPERATKARRGEKAAK